MSNGLLWVAIHALAQAASPSRVLSLKSAASQSASCSKSSSASLCLPRRLNSLIFRMAALFSRRDRGTTMGGTAPVVSHSVTHVIAGMDALLIGESWAQLPCECPAWSVFLHVDRAHCLGEVMTRDRKLIKLWPASFGTIVQCRGWLG